MDDAAIQQRVREARVGRLATVTAGGAPHVVPCCFVLGSRGGRHSRDGLDGETVYSAVDGKPKSTLALRRLANVRAHPAAALLVDHYDDDWSALWWIRVDGTARVLDDGADDAEHGRALDLLAAKYPQYREQRPPGAVLALDVERWRSWAP